MVNRGIIFFLFYLFVAMVAQAQEPDADSFGPDYTKACLWIQTTTPYWQKMAAEGYDIQLAKSIVFPELLRFNRLRDKIELFGLQVLYIQFGKDYADFSIGPFQMKPSFAELIEESNKKTKNILSRNARIDLLNTTAGQFRYLRWFMQWMDNTYSDKKWRSKEEKTRFYASAYNCGFNKQEKYITFMLDRKYFRLQETSPETFNYSAIAIWYYHKTCALANNQFDYLYDNNSKIP